MDFRRSLFSVTNNIYIKKKTKFSNASHYVTRLALLLPIQHKFKKLLLKKMSVSGRAATGRIVIFSKGPRRGVRAPTTCYKFREKYVCFVAGFNYSNCRNKISSLLFSSVGGILYIPTTQQDVLFLLRRMRGYQNKSPHALKELLISKPLVRFFQTSFLLIQQTKHSSLSFLEDYPLRGVRYTRSLGSKAVLTKLDTRTGLGLVKLSSGVRKVFSAFSLASAGEAMLFLNKGRLVSTKSGDFRRKGLKPKTRGVAKNPVDHPHGGRTTSIKYQRTPWGKTTKFK